MFISNVTNQGLSSTIWNAASRTLTADPATDAGCATLVWARATRSLTVDPATDAGCATLVWARATRSLTVDPATDAGAATLVWARATRALTNIGSVGSVAHTAFASITAGTTLDLRVGVNKWRIAFLAVGNNAAASTCLVGLYDGTNFIAMYYNATSNEGAGGYVAGDNVVGPAIKNGDASARSYNGTFIDFVQ